MTWTNTLLCALIFTPKIAGFLFAAPSCSCPPAMVCPPMHHIPCKSAHNTVHSSKTFMAHDQPLDDYRMPRVMTMPDELDLRAAVFGVPLVPNSQQNTVFDVLHNLGEEGAASRQNTIAEGTANTDYFPKEDDDDLTAMTQGRGGFFISKDIRRAPTIHVQQDQVETGVVDVRKETDDKLDENKCNSNVLRKLMLENMSDSSSESKKNINEAAESKFGGNVDVICSRGHFSYIFTSNLFCEATKGLTTCIAFRQAEKKQSR